MYNRCKEKGGTEWEWIWGWRSKHMGQTPAYIEAGPQRGWIQSDPAVRFHRILLWLDLCYSTEKENQMETEQETSKKEEKNREVESTTHDGRCERTFITFLDEQVFRNVFPQTQPKPLPRNVCPITRYSISHVT
jgi:hypothetical protein